MKKITFVSLAAFILITSNVSSVAARGGDGGDREVDRGTESYFDETTVDRSDDRSDSSRTAKLTVKGCDPDMDFKIQGVCYDGRL